MHAPSARHRDRAFTKIELTVVVAAIAIISAVAVVAVGKATQRAKRIHCANNLKQISTGFRLFASDTGAPYGEDMFALLSRTSNSAPGLTPFAANNPAELWKLFRRAADHIVLASSLVCPADRGRVAADRFATNGLGTEFSHPSNRLNALSCFLPLNASEASPDHILMGDRHLTTDPEASSDTETKSLFGQQGAGLTVPLDELTEIIAHRPAGAEVMVVGELSVEGRGFVGLDDAAGERRGGGQFGGAGIFHPRGGSPNRGPVFSGDFSPLSPTTSPAKRQNTAPPTGSAR